MARRALTPLQRVVIARLHFRGLNVLAEIVDLKWSNGERCGIVLSDHPRLRADFERANAQVVERSRKGLAV